MSSADKSAPFDRVVTACAVRRDDTRLPRQPDREFRRRHPEQAPSQPSYSCDSWSKVLLCLERCSHLCQSAPSADKSAPFDRVVTACADRRDHSRSPRKPDREFRRRYPEQAPSKPSYSCDSCDSWLKVLLCLERCSHLCQSASSADKSAPFDRVVTACAVRRDDTRPPRKPDREFRRRYPEQAPSQPSYSCDSCDSWLKVLLRLERSSASISVICGQLFLTDPSVPFRAWSMVPSAVRCNFICVNRRPLRTSLLHSIAL